ncbi:MAG: TIGR03619 family F420-dependent LLM class oxidoreductase [Gammaproteobacteria bacterium]|nr:TIGR03619 family F420-dependent LLM class oxidoreductase [Gammaproteobacteria bacterium]
MKFAIRLPANILYKALTSPWEATLHPQKAVHFARAVDELAYDYLWVAEHILQHPKLVPSMGAKFYEGVSAAGFLLGATQRIHLLTYVCPIPYHNPVVWAKAIASVDHLSCGRLALGLAAGHLKREFEAIGVPFEKRGAICDEYLRAMKALWTQDQPEFHGEFVSFSNMVFEPRPWQSPHPPLLIGGDAKPVLRRAATLGDGWLPWQTTLREMKSAVAYIYEQPAMQVRSRPFEIFTLLAEIPEDDRLNFDKMRYPRYKEETVDLVGRLQEAGATGMVVHLPKTDSYEECLDWVRWFSHEIIPLYRT